MAPVHGARCHTQPGDTGAQLQAHLLGLGAVGDTGLLDPAVVERIFDQQAAGRDLILGFGVTFGIGFALNSPRNPIAPSRRVCYWGGWGGSLVVNDLDNRISMAYVMNRMGRKTTGDSRAHSLLQAVYTSLEH